MHKHRPLVIRIVSDRFDPALVGVVERASSNWEIAGRSRKLIKTAPAQHDLSEFRIVERSYAPSAGQRAIAGNAIERSRDRLTFQPSIETKFGLGDFSRER